MKIDALSGGSSGTAVTVAEQAVELEEAGYDMAWASESSNDSFVSLAFTAAKTKRIGLGNGIAVAFARNPMNVAILANDLQIVSEGRYYLGLGSQVRAHVERRFNMPWHKPAPQMREFIQAVRAIWASWEDGSKLDFQGEYYKHTLMTPSFSPGPNPYGNPKIALASVGPIMTQVAGEVADAVMCHSFTTPEYIRNVTIPAMHKGIEKAGRNADDVELICQIFVATGETDEEIQAEANELRKLVAFYGSTPAYHGVLESVGLSDLHEKLKLGARAGEWNEMAEMITDDLLNKFVVIGNPKDAAQEINSRYGDFAGRVSFYSSGDTEPARWTPLLHELRVLVGS